VHQLIVVRFLLGIAEAGYFPGMLLYLTYWYRQKEQARAIALLLTGLPIASIIGAPLGGLILDHIHWLGLSSWRWLLILEGIPAVLSGFLTYSLLPSRPADANFLSLEEKSHLIACLAAEEQEKLAAQTVTVAQIFSSLRVWHLSAAIFFLNVGMYTLSFWLPQMVKSLSTTNSNVRIGILVMIPHLVGAIAMVLVARSSDRRLERRFHASIPAICGGCAMISLGAAHSLSASIVLLCIAALGAYSFFGPFFSIPSSFLTGYSAAAGLALVTAVGNLGGFVGPYAVGFLKEKTGNMYLGLTVVGFSMLLSASLLLLLPKASRSTNPS
jgi:predicted MFS family arabinose efflux permease